MTEPVGSPHQTLWRAFSKMFYEEKASVFWYFSIMGLFVKSHMPVQYGLSTLSVYVYTDYAICFKLKWEEKI